MTDIGSRSAWLSRSLPDTNCVPTSRCAFLAREMTRLRRELERELLGPPATFASLRGLPASNCVVGYYRVGQKQRSLADA